jgi:hypothetical protein
VTAETRLGCEEIVGLGVTPSKVPIDIHERWTRARAGTLAKPMANKIPSGRKVLGYSLGTFLIAFPAMILVYRMMS